MEIREGMKYQILDKDLITVLKTATLHVDLFKSDMFYAYLGPKNQYISFTSELWINSFKTDKEFKIIEYPYKVGDWVYCTNSKYSNNSTPKITQITYIIQSTTLLIYVNNETNYLKIHDFNENWRPCFKDEIPVNEAKLEVKEDMSYLIPFLKN